MESRASKLFNKNVKAISKQPFNNFYADLSLSTFIVKAIDSGIKIDKNLFEVIATLQFEMDFNKLVSFFVQ